MYCYTITKKTSDTEEELVRAYFRHSPQLLLFNKISTECYGPAEALRPGYQIPTSHHQNGPDGFTYYSFSRGPLDDITRYDASCFEVDEKKFSSDLSDMLQRHTSIIFLHDETVPHTLHRLNGEYHYLPIDSF